MSNMVARERKRFSFWLTVALLLVGTIIGVGIANIPTAASKPVVQVASLTSWPTGAAPNLYAMNSGDPAQTFAGARSTFL